MYLELWKAQHSTNPPFHRRRFTEEEDRKLRSLVEKLGTGSWEEIAEFLPRRSGRQCRDRYKNYLLDSLVTNPWTAEEDALIIEKFHQIGPKWVEIGKMLHGRSGNSVKNRWYKQLSKMEPAQQTHPLPVPDIGRVSGANEHKQVINLSQPPSIPEDHWSMIFEQKDADSPNNGWSGPFSSSEVLF
jgi:hypothetical protein